MLEMLQLFLGKTDVQMFIDAGDGTRHLWPFSKNRLNGRGARFEAQCVSGRSGLGDVTTFD